MDPNVKRKTEALAEALASSDMYAELVAAREDIDRHEAAKIMLRDFVAKQQQLQEQLMQGEQPSESDVADYQRTAEIVGMNPYVRRLLEAEMAFSDMMMEIQRELARAVGMELPDEPGAEVTPEPEAVEKPPQSRLWVPGQ